MLLCQQRDTCLQAEEQPCWKRPVTGDDQESHLSQGCVLADSKASCIVGYAGRSTASRLREAIVLV